MSATLSYQETDIIDVTGTMPAPPLQWFLPGPDSTPGNETAGHLVMTTGSKQYSTLPTLASDRWAERVALRFERQIWTYRDLERAIVRTAGRLAAAGIGAGTRTLLLMENRPEYVISQFALARLGAVFVTPNPYWTDHEIRGAISTVGARAAIFSERHRSTASGLPITVSALDLDGGESIDHSRQPPEDLSSVAAAAELCIPFSSGTTGFPKGVVHTRASLSSGIQQLVRHLRLTQADRLQISLPLCHIFGTSMMGAAVSVGAEVTLFERFDFDRCLRQVRQDAVTVWPLAGTVVHRLAEMPEISRANFPGLRFFMWGGSATPVRLAEAITARTGIGFLCSYGMTEAFAVAFNPVDRPDLWRLDSPGFATAGTQIRLGQDGEIEVRGSCVASGYTVVAEEPFLRDGWFRTGDVGRVDGDGRLWILDRRKDMIKVSGFQVAPTEVEAELVRHPFVTDAAVIGCPDERRGERIVAFVVTSAPVCPDELRGMVAERLATYKIPGEIVNVHKLPRSPAGKLQRARLREEADRRQAP